MEGPNTPEMWQVVGDREWELADEYGYPRGVHYRIAREKRSTWADTDQSANGKRGKGVKKPGVSLFNENTK